MSEYGFSNKEAAENITAECWNDSYNEYDAPVITDEDIEEMEAEEEAWMHQTMEKAADDIAEKYHLDEKEVRPIRELFQCRYNTLDECNRDMIPRYNVLLTANDEERALEMVRDIEKMLYSISERDICYVNEGELLTIGSLNPEVKGLEAERWSRTYIRTLSEYGAICINGCADEPHAFSDAPSSSERQRNLNMIKNYKVFWDTIKKFSEENPECPVITVLDNGVYRRSFKHNARLLSCIGAHQVNVPDMTIDEVYEECMGMFAPFELKEGFAEEVRSYLEADYPGTDLPRKEFFGELKNHVLTEYSLKNISGRGLEKDMVPEPASDIAAPEEVFRRVDAMIGLESVKTSLREMYAVAKSGIGTDSRYHMVFLGNPGVGKTSVGKDITEMLYSMGIIKKNKLVLTTPNDFISQWKNNTGTKVMEKIEEARGGVLFIDEAYNLANSDMESNDSKKLAVQLLMTEMEENADSIVVVLAGYEQEMDNLMKMNPGLRSRIRFFFRFEDYTAEQLKEIFYTFVKADGFGLSDEADGMIDDMICERMSREHFGNGRDMRNLWEEIKSAWIKDTYMVRDGQEEPSAPRIIEVHILEKIMPQKTRIRLDDLTGLRSVKTKFEQYKSELLYRKMLETKGGKMPPFSRHMAFLGNPGTAKTTVAKLMGQDFYSIGVLKTNKCVALSVKELMTGYNPVEKLEGYIRKAVGGILFIDEAYCLNRSGWGEKIVEALLTAMEDHKDDMIFILAGYPREMNELFNVNPGLESRVHNIFSFEDYSLEELYEIFRNKMEERSFVLTDGVEEAVKELTDYFMDTDHFGNGRFMENLMANVILKRAQRAYDEDDAMEIEKADIPSIGEYLEIVNGGKAMYDPKKRNESARRRTAIHEMGHALVALLTDRDSVPERISIRNRSSSLGRVELAKDTCPEMTVQWCKDHIACLLAGKNAEVVFLGENSAGCSNDFKRAKDLAKRMLKEFAMGTPGMNKKKDIIREADERSVAMIEKYRGFIEKMVEELLEKKEISGADMRTAFDKYLEGNDDSCITRAAML